MKSKEEQKEYFIKYLESDYGVKIQEGTFPYVLLHDAITMYPNIMHNGVAVLEKLNDRQLLCYIYGEFKNHYQILLKGYIENPNSYLTIRQIRVKDIGSHKLEIDTLFKKIDELNVFEPIDIYSINIRTSTSVNPYIYCTSLHRSTVVKGRGAE